MKVFALIANISIGMARSSSSMFVKQNRGTLFYIPMSYFFSDFLTLKQVPLEFTHRTIVIFRGQHNMPLLAGKLQRSTKK